MQREDKANFYNNTLFKSNGNCGYVLKPDHLFALPTFDQNNLTGW